MHIYHHVKVTEVDDDGFICYVNIRTKVTKSILEKDPRFEALPDSYEVEVQKAENAKDMSMGVYLCNSLLEGYLTLPEEVTYINKYIFYSFSFFLVISVYKRIFKAW